MAGGRASDVLHHVMGRGIERKRLFIDKRDRQDFDTRLPALALKSYARSARESPKTNYLHQISDRKTGRRF